MGLRLLIIVALFLVVEIYAYQAVRTLFKPKWLLISYALISLFLLVYIVYSFMQFDRAVGQTQHTMFVMGLMLLVYLPKIVITVILLGEDVFRLGASLVNYLMYNLPKNELMPERRKFVSQLALGLAAVPFLSLLYGIFEGKYNFKVIKQTVFFPDLPDAFDGFKITQISDVHSGSFDNHEKINYAIDLINDQETDMILFTGDIVNTHATEMHPWLNTFNRIKKYKYGKFAVLGNHDYGEYVTWPSQKAKDDNFKGIKNLYGQIGFDLLLNEHRFIEKDGQKLALVGVENWGKNFKQAGDLNKAALGVNQNDFKILMSHDPSHWEYEIKEHPKNFHLTFSGHTHGMQFGIEIPGVFKWSVAEYIYKQWAGLYENKGRYVYVNRGFGYHAYPGRVGIMPEITVIELKKGSNVG
ncbi:metallophosphoesterase [Flavobacterium agrisoli]|uniref:Metallophosphoesterase n=1 Tax=Flavobacterium agrisoli TaxID=2793066 RepID=A0A934UK36_9FLAO|nr:metallophosphoesterase [Flavobacterium agrisoli]MBK0370532.1 metallophosphoesterase [Flavobacterium agrisoli]